MPGLAESPQWQALAAHRDALASYHLIEQPFLRLRDRLWPAKTLSARVDTRRPIEAVP